MRDFHEDYHEDRIFWPKTVWQQYCNELGDFIADNDQGVKCLDHLICDAIKHLPQCFEYLREFKNDRMFKFCAIPQIMALATLNLCFGNREVFQKNVKIRRGLSAKYAYKTENYNSFCEEAKIYI